MIESESSRLNTIQKLKKKDAFKSENIKIQFQLNDVDQLALCCLIANWVIVLPIFNEDYVSIFGVLTKIIKIDIQLIHKYQIGHSKAISAHHIINVYKTATELSPKETQTRKVTDVHGPAMTWAIYSINWFNLNNTNKAEDLFTKNYKYITSPFYVWSESINGQGAINFLTGMGGYLQNIVNGFLGMRLELSGNGQMAFSPSKSTVIGGLMLHNLKFQGAHINLKYNNQNVTLELINDSGLRVFAYQNKTTYILNGTHKNVTFPIQRFVLTKIN